ncbi:MAG: energy transducer TonB [Nitrospinota bacterium]
MVQAAPLPEASPPPAYPRLAWRRGYEGRVRLLVTVSVQGLPVGIEVLGSSGHESLDEAAIEAVRKWRFQPATTAGRPVESRLVVPVRFRIDS